MKQIKTKLTGWSKFGGIKIGDEWYNPKNNEIKAQYEHFKGKEVLLTVDEKNKVVAISEPNPTQIRHKSDTIDKTNYWERKLEWEKENSERIARMSAVNSAINLLGQGKPISKVLETAQQIYDWVRSD